MDTPLEPLGLEKALEQRLLDRQARSQLRRLSTFPSTTVDFSSNSYLSLSTIPEIRQAFLSRLESHDPALPLFGSGGSRLLDGNSTEAEALEREIAAFHNAPAGLLFNSGFDANVGLLSCVIQPGDTVVYDELIHASAHDGMRMSRAAQRVPFRHNTVSSAQGGPLGSLAEVLASLTRGDAGRDYRDGTKTIFVAVEAVYSMDGDVAPLRDIVACISQYLPRGNGRLIVDEAHSTGLFGKDGRGLVCELGLERQVFARLHTFGKAMGASGAIVLCSPIVREYLVNYARTLIYTTAMPPACLAGIKVAYDSLTTARVEALRTHLRSLTAHAHGLLSSVCEVHRRDEDRGQATPLLRIDPAPPRSPILALMSAQPRSLARHCQERGFLVRPIVAPTVPRGSERVRICLHAGNTREQVEGLARAVDEWARGEQQLGAGGEGFRDMQMQAPDKPRL
ncbi:8-amino-7-oxononanoate synthase [Plectosphaerella cucumerina]|uniref:8-amino-7-oxononanoate synthase n=1 Tax=Plectosphaerella cucumerina TaxID=40658 RepID=A0A8K0X184_9PEZI|nr:8-amino-7-oxononanoate synthase [Plectosphaerella cucumerina]